MTSLSAVTCSEAPAGVLVLDGVPCSCWHPTDEECAACPGQFPPRVSVGQRIAVARPCEVCGGDGVDHEVVGVMDDGTEVEVNCEVCDGKGGLLVGTVTATTEALPIVDHTQDAPLPLLELPRLGGHLNYWVSGRPPRRIDLSSLPDDLVGRWAVLVEPLVPTTERCPFGHDDPPMFRSEDIDSDAPLDGTRLAADIARTVPEANREVRRSEWRSEMKRRARDRMACPACSCPPLPVSPGPERVLWTLDLAEVAR